jgi:hypothetical protein
MQKVHGPALEPPVHGRHGYFEQPAMRALLVSLALLLVVCALIYFGFVGTR